MILRLSSMFRIMNSKRVVYIEYDHYLEGMKFHVLSIIPLFVCMFACAQTKTVTWPAGNSQQGEVVLDLSPSRPLFKSISLGGQVITENVDPAFMMTIGERDLQSQNGWNIFFDKVPDKPYKTYPVVIKKSSVSVKTEGSRTVVSVGPVSAANFSGQLEITFYNGSPLVNIAAVVSTQDTAKAIVFDAGIVSPKPDWKNILWTNTGDSLKQTPVLVNDSVHNLAVKYRAIAATTDKGSITVFPPPHQYFYPLDEAFNLKFTWYGQWEHYGIGIRQELQGDKRFVPWFNAPPGTKQRLNFFCLLSNKQDGFAALKAFTHGDKYVQLPGYKTMSSHFHNEYVMKVMMAGKKDKPDFVQVFKDLGVDIVHLAEFHYTADPKGPDEKRLPQLKALFELCEQQSDNQFLLLPGEEPNEFFGGHWLNIFPKPVYWVMSRKADQPYVEEKPGYGKVYHIADKKEMLQLLKDEQGLAWTAHPRTKGSVNTPDSYKNEDFFLSDRFMGAAWKAMPADLSQPRLGKRVLDLLDDMNNWGAKKTIISEADLFTITQHNEMYAHMNVNYLMLDKLPAFKESWSPVLDAMQHGKFFSSTGEVLMPSLKIIGSTIDLKLQWTFPMNFVEIISGDGKQVYRENISLINTEAFGEKSFKFNAKLAGRKWVRVEAWDIAANGAFSQTFYLDKK